MQLSDYQISDIIYALSFRLDMLHDSVLQELAQTENQEQFIEQVQFHFVYDYQKDLFTSTNLLEKVKLYPQDEIDQIFTDFALYFHEYIDTSFFEERGIDQFQIKEYKLGSTNILYNTEITGPFIDTLRNKYDKTLVDKILYFHLKSLNSIKRIHQSNNFVTIPDFDKNNICRGIVYRTERFEKINGLRNFHKFFVSHAPLYWFNSQAIELYDDLIIVEGVFDALKLLKLGIKNVISPSSTRISKYEYEKIKNKNLHLIFDKDEGGVFGLELFFKSHDNEERIFSTSYDLLNDKRDFDELEDEDIFNFLKSNEIKFILN